MVFPFVHSLPEESQKKIIQTEVKKGTTMLWDGDTCEYATFVYKGEVRVHKANKNGRVVNLYKVLPGEACILTITSALSSQPYPASAEALKDTSLLLIHKHDLKEWLSEYPQLQEVVYQHTAKRFISMMALFDDLLFKKIDERVIEFLLDRLTEDENSIAITHDEMAIELGTVREVISRILKSLEKAKILSLSRGKIQLINRLALEEKMTNL
jgi:CRP/FNR family transcriptional regulator